MTKVLITQSKLDTLAEVIGGKSNTNVPLTVDEMITAADSITGGGGITPTGNIDITSAGVTDVTNYATATVPQGQMYADYIRGYKTVSGIKKWYVQPFAAIESGDEFGTEGYIADHTTEYGAEITYNAVPSGTTVTPVHIVTDYRRSKLHDGRSCNSFRNANRYGRYTDSHKRRSK